MMRFKTVSRAGMLVASSLLLSRPCAAMQVTVVYEAEALTVVKAPFGVAVPRLTKVAGSFTYETSTADTYWDEDDEIRGKFVHSGTGAFRAEFLGHVVTGSGSPVASTNIFGTDTRTMRYEDGDGHFEAGTMAFDGAAREDIGLILAIVGTPEDLPTDRLPEQFKFPDAPHTFALRDASGEMLLQFLSYRQVAADFRIQAVEQAGDQVTVSWRSSPNTAYSVEFSVDLKTWAAISGSIPGQEWETSFTDDLATRYSGSSIPAVGYYRVVDHGP